MYKYPIGTKVIVTYKETNNTYLGTLTYYNMNSSYPYTFKVEQRININNLSSSASIGEEISTADHELTACYVEEGPVIYAT